MLFKVLAELRLPSIAELRHRYLKSGNLLIIAGLLLLCWGLISSFIQNQKGLNGWWNPLSAGHAPRSSMLAAATPTAEVYLIAVPTATITPSDPTPTKPSPTPLPSGVPSATPTPNYRPDWIRIPLIHLEAPVVPVRAKTVQINGDSYLQWQAPNEFAAGWQSETAPLGQIGNTVLNGHNNIYGEVFRRLSDLKFGDKILVNSGARVFVYRVTNKMTFHELYQGIDERLEHARWLMPSEDERLTLVTCWPYWSNAYRLVIVAKPVDQYLETDNILQR